MSSPDLDLSIFDTPIKTVRKRKTYSDPDPDPQFTTLARSVASVSHGEMEGFETPYIDRFWGDVKILPEIETKLSPSKKRGVNGGKKQKTNKKVKSKKRGKRTRKNRKVKK